MYYVYSTLTSNVNYTLYRDADRKKIKAKSVLIKGGANLCRAGEDGKFRTAKGVVTVVKDEDFPVLEQCPVFKRHCDRGFITVEKSEKKIDKIVADMQACDKSAPKTEATLPTKNKKLMGEE